MCYQAREQKQQQIHTNKPSLIPASKQNNAQTYFRSSDGNN